MAFLFYPIIRSDSVVSVDKSEQCCRYKEWKYFCWITSRKYPICEEMERNVGIPLLEACSLYFRLRNFLNNFVLDLHIIGGETQ
jgi:hypothetical protein